MYVKETVPKEHLLVWNVKDGWEPLCKFLDAPVPSSPLPHDNKTGDSKFVENYVFGNPIWQRAEQTFKRNILSDVMNCITLTAIGYTAWKAYQSERNWDLTIGPDFLNFKFSIFLERESAGDRHPHKK